MWGRGARAPLGVQTGRPPCKAAWKLPKESKTELPRDPATPLLGVHPVIRFTPPAARPARKVNGGLHFKGCLRSRAVGLPPYFGDVSAEPHSPATPFLDTLRDTRQRGRERIPPTLRVLGKVPDKRWEMGRGEQRPTLGPPQQRECRQSLLAPDT